MNIFIDTDSWMQIFRYYILRQTFSATFIYGNCAWSLVNNYERMLIQNSKNPDPFLLTLNENIGLILQYQCNNQKDIFCVIMSDWNVEWVDLCW